MAFISVEFLLFFAAAVIVYFVLPPRVRWIWLLAASVYFYAVTGIAYLAQILIATALIFVIGRGIGDAEDKKRKQSLLTAGILLLVANLFVFKYAGFVNESIRDAFTAAGWAYPAPPLELLAPLGISFYTFQLVGYLIDVFRGEKPERDLGRFTLFVMLFPKMISGPIERGRNLLPQLHVVQLFEVARVVAGLQLMLWGAFKKVVVADRIAPFVSNVYDNPQWHGAVEIISATVLYAFQLYFDFSGYTDMAIGAALVLGFKLMENFNRPYFATSIQDFWKRWHISLTSWLTDYVYTPLTRSTWIKVKWRDLMLASLFVTFLISGIWHGAGWSFVLWGVLHGTYIVTSHLLQKPYNDFARKSGLIKRKQLHKALKMSVTFALVCFAYIFFRSADVQSAFLTLSRLGVWEAPFYQVRHFIDGRYVEFGLAILGIIVVMAPEFAPKRDAWKERFSASPVWLRWGAYYAAMLAIFLLGAQWGSTQQFIYFRF